eukprot:scaffold59161_cov19-Tisochrysis_lutea.AAC.4
MDFIRRQTSCNVEAVRAPQTCCKQPHMWLCGSTVQSCAPLHGTSLICQHKAPPLQQHCGCGMAYMACLFHGNSGKPSTKHAQLFEPKLTATTRSIRALSIVVFPVALLAGKSALEKKDQQVLSKLKTCNKLKGFRKTAKACDLKDSAGEDDEDKEMEDAVQHTEQPVAEHMLQVTDSYIRIYRCVKQSTDAYGKGQGVDFGAGSPCLWNVHACSLCSVCHAILGTSTPCAPHHPEQQLYILCP